MRIFIDIGHPAHVHYFRNFIKIMEKKGHSFFISAREKEVTHSLLEYYGIKYSSRGQGKRSIIGKLLYIIKGDFILYKLAKKFKPDIFLSFSSTYAAHVSKLLGKPHIVFDDTEHAKLEHLLYIPFSDVILTPSCFTKRFGKKQLFFNGYMELCYLHPKYFFPNNKIKELIGIDDSEQYVVLRFVSWSASHDIGQKGLKDETKYQIIELLKTKYRILISSEKPLPTDLKKYEIKINPANLHSVLANAVLYIGEGSTTASECSVLGIPNIYINSLTVGYCTEQEQKYGLSFHLTDDDKILPLMKSIIDREDLMSEWKIKREKMLKDKIDVTDFMVWFIENYPRSYGIMQESPDYQLKFL